MTVYYYTQVYIELYRVCYCKALISASYSPMPTSASALSASLDADERCCLHLSSPCLAAC